MSSRWRTDQVCVNAPLWASTWTSVMSQRAQQLPISLIFCLCPSFQPCRISITFSQEAKKWLLFFPTRASKQMAKHCVFLKTVIRVHWKINHVRSLELEKRNNSLNIGVFPLYCDQKLSRRSQTARILLLLTFWFFSPTSMNKPACL